MLAEEVSVDETKAVAKITRQDCDDFSNSGPKSRTPHKRGSVGQLNFVICRCH